MYKSYDSCDFDYLYKVVCYVKPDRPTPEELLKTVWCTSEGKQPTIFVPYAYIHEIVTEHEDLSFTSEPDNKTYRCNLDEEQIDLYIETLKSTKWGSPERAFVSTLLEKYSYGRVTLILDQDIFPSLSYPDPSSEEGRDLIRTYGLSTTFENEITSYDFSPKKDLDVDYYAPCMMFKFSILEVIYPDTDWNKVCFELGLDQLGDDFGEEFELRRDGRKTRPDNKELNLPEKRRLFFEGWLAGKGIPKPHEFTDLTHRQVWELLNRANPTLFPNRSDKSIEGFFGQQLEISFKSGRKKSQSP